MNITRNVIVVTVLGLMGSVGVQAQSGTATPSTTAAADNTRSNKVDASNRSPTSDDQKNDKQDLMLTKLIRSSIVADKSLSTYAHNIKIVSINGNVTLNGVVRSQAEKDTLGTKAQAVVTNGSVTNELKIAPAQ